MAEMNKRPGSYERTKEIREKNRLSNLGQKAWNKGLPRKQWNPILESEEAKNKIRLIGLANKGRKRQDLTKRNKSMKGKSKPGYNFWRGQTMYRRYAKENLPQKCNECHVDNKLVVHHIDTDHFNNSSDNLEVLCRSCHMKIHQKTIGVMEDC